MKHGTITVAACLLTLAAACLPALAQQKDKSVPIQQALDRPIDFEVADGLIGDIFAKLGQAAGVKFVIDNDTLEFLAYGEQTRMGVKIEKSTLRNALTRMLAYQALRWEVAGDTIRIVPEDSLYRIGRRATFEEINILGKIHTVKMLAGEAGGEGVVEQLRKTTGNSDLKIVFLVQVDKEAAFKRADRALPCTAAAWLDELTRDENWTWYLWGDEIKIIDRKTQISRQLQRSVSLNYQNADLMSVLVDLAKKGRVQLDMDPGVLNLLPTATRNNFNLMLSEATVAQAIEMISGATGLQFIRTNEGLKVEPGEALKGTRSGDSRRSPFLVKMNIAGPGGSDVEVYLRPEELPEDVVQQIMAEKEKMIQRIRAARPTTAPATQPATTSAQ